MNPDFQLLPELIFYEWNLVISFALNFALFQNSLLLVQCVHAVLAIVIFLKHYCVWESHTLVSEWLMYFFVLSLTILHSVVRQWHHYYLLILSMVSLCECTSMQSLCCLEPTIFLVVFQGYCFFFASQLATRNDPWRIAKGLTVYFPIFLYWFLFVYFAISMLG